MLVTPGGTAASSPAEESKSVFYTDKDSEKEEEESEERPPSADAISREKIMSSSEEEVAGLRGELEVIQRALRLQTRRCRQLVTEYTKRLQQKEHHYQAEKRLRDEQLAKVLRALLIFEARLKQEQKLITRRLREKDQIIRQQREEMQKLAAAGGRYCRKCNSSIPPPRLVDNFEDSSSEYVATTDYQDYYYYYQSSNLESLDSSSETYASISEKDFDLNKRLNRLSNPSLSSEDNLKLAPDQRKSRHLYAKNKNSLTRRSKKFLHKKNQQQEHGGIFLIRGADARSLTSTEENSIGTSNDYENLDLSLSGGLNNSLSEGGNLEENDDEDGISKLDDEQSTYSYDVSDSLDTTVIVNNHQKDEDKVAKKCTSPANVDQDQEEPAANSKISDTIAIFEVDEEANDNTANWYASASDQEDEERRDVYRNNPVLECMNQILLQNINDISSPPKSPNVEKRAANPTPACKKVKFSDEEEKQQPSSTHADYYETPIQKSPNFYETPQSIYSNDYEQILSQCSETFGSDKIPEALSPKSDASPNRKPKLFSSGNSDESSNHYYIDMDSTKSENELRVCEVAPMIRRSKILRTPPALPPKPANLISKYRTQLSWNEHSEQDLSCSSSSSSSSSSLSKSKDEKSCAESEPDYCSISEINLPKEPTAKLESLQKSCFPTPVARKLSLPPEEPPATTISASPIACKLSGLTETASTTNLASSPPKTPAQYKPISLSEPISPSKNLAIKKSVDKLFKTTPTSSIPKKTPIKNFSETKKSPISDEIPKLPQVTEIIIPADETEAISEEYVNHDNYIKNNTQILKQQHVHTDSNRTNGTNATNRPVIQMGSSVSSLIASFNNKQMSEIKQQRQKSVTVKERNEENNNKRRLFSSFENLNQRDRVAEETNHKTFDVFDLSQNFEEFKLDDCEIADYGDDEGYRNEDVKIITDEQQQHSLLRNGPSSKLGGTARSSTRVEVVRATNDFSLPHLRKRHTEKDKSRSSIISKYATPEDVDQNAAVTPTKSGYIGEPTYEHFLECTGLSSKSILTPSRLLSNHKNVLKPKDVKLRSKIRSNVFDKPIENGTIRYWSEPYL